MGEVGEAAATPVVSLLADSGVREAAESGVLEADGGSGLSWLASVGEVSPCSTQRRLATRGGDKMESDEALSARARVAVVVGAADEVESSLPLDFVLSL